MRKWFNKKKSNNDSEETTNPQEKSNPAQENYTAMSSNSLYSLPVNDLVSIIFKFDLEVKNLNKELAATSELAQQAKIDLPKYQEQALLYKEHQETLQSECNKLAIQLNEAVTSLDSKQAQIDLYKTQISSRDELINSYKLQIQQQEKQILDLQISGITTVAGNEGNVLKEKIEENRKFVAEINELKIKNRMLEAEVTKLSGSVADDREQIRIWRDKTNLFENARKEAEIELEKTKAALEGSNKEISRLIFLKESMETENRSFKESLNHKELKIKKKQQKLENLQTSFTEMVQRNTILKCESESIQAKHAEAMQEVIKRCESEKNQNAAQFHEKVLAINEKLATLEVAEEKAAELEKNCEELKSSIAALQNSLSKSLEELCEKTCRITIIEEAHAKAVDSLNKSNQKRELARNEIIKLTQKLEAQTAAKGLVISQDVPVKISDNATQREIDLSTLVKNELESLYKTLMKIIFQAEGDKYLIKVDDFTNFEKRLNNLVMLLYEQLEEISVEKNSLSLRASLAIKPPRGRIPIKLFSCISEQEEAPRLIPKPKRPVQQVDNHMILRRGSAN